MDNRPVFVLITSKVCPSCHGFKKKVWPDLRRELEHEDKVKIITIDVPTLDSKPDPDKYHPDLKRYIGWFPTVSLFPASSWRDRSSELKGIIKDGRIIPAGHDKNGKFQPERVAIVVKPNVTKNSILNWVDKTLNENRLFNPSLAEQNSIMIVNNGKPVQGFSSDGKMIVPTSGHYYRLKHSKVK